MLEISELYIYPIKSMAGIALKEARVTATGFEHDRRWMLVDENNRFISQREVPAMAQMKQLIEHNGLRVNFRNETILITFNTPSALSRERVEVTIWDDTSTGEFVSPEADEWFSVMMGVKCRLVYMPDDIERVVDQRYALNNSITSFADAYPFLLIGQASLDDLNSRMDTSLPMNRFRPNLVFTGGDPFEEDSMAHISIAGIDFFGVKLCARCPIPTIDQDTAAKGKEPLKTLSKYRQKNNKVYFGQNLVHKGDGVVTVGDKLKVLELAHDERFLIPVV
jgi:uncharacterized protein